MSVTMKYKLYTHTWCHRILLANSDWTFQIDKLTTCVLMGHICQMLLLMIYYFGEKVLMIYYLGEKAFKYPGKIGKSAHTRTHVRTRALRETRHIFWDKWSTAIVITFIHSHHYGGRNHAKRPPAYQQQLGVQSLVQGHCNTQPRVAGDQTRNL